MGEFMKVKDIMTKYLITAESNSSIHQIAQKMKNFDIGFMIITNDHKIEGIITDRDIVIEMIANYDHKVKDYIRKNIETIDESKTVENALDIMKNKKIKRLLVTDKNKAVGVLSISDILNKVEEKDKIIETFKSIYEIQKNTDLYKTEIDEFYL